MATCTTKINFRASLSCPSTIHLQVKQVRPITWRHSGRKPARCLPTYRATGKSLYSSPISTFRSPKCPRHGSVADDQQAPPQDGVSTVVAAVPTSTPELAEEVFYEGHGGSSLELALSLALTATLIFAPLTIASLGRRLWIKYKFTNKSEVL